MKQLVFTSWQKRNMSLIPKIKNTGSSKPEIKFKPKVWVPYDKSRITA